MQLPVNTYDTIPGAVLLDRANNQFYLKVAEGTTFGENMDELLMRAALRHWIVGEGQPDMVLKIVAQRGVMSGDPAYRSTLPTRELLTALIEKVREEREARAHNVR